MKKFRTLFICILVILIVLIRNNWINYKEESFLKQSKVLIYGNITHFGYLIGSSRGNAYFTYNVADKPFSNHFSHSSFCHKLSRSEENEILETKIPIIYYLNDPQVSRILLKQKDYEKFKVPYPDSLAPFLENYFECTRLERFLGY